MYSVTTRVAGICHTRWRLAMLCLITTVFSLRHLRQALFTSIRHKVRRAWTRSAILNSLLFPGRDLDLLFDYRESNHETMRSASAAPCGILPSARSFSILAISARLRAFLMSSCTLFFSLSVSCVRIALGVGAPLVAPDDASEVWVLTPRIFAASSEGSVGVPKRSLACCRSTSRIRW
jgi:hypothetical protein